MIDPALDLADFDALRHARALWGRLALDDALDAYSRALRERPHNLMALIEAARAFGACHQVARAEDLLADAARLGGHDRRVPPVIAQAYARIFRLHRAAAAFEAIPADEIPPPMLGELATVREQLGRLDEALDAIDACIARAPNAPEPRLVRARLLRRLGRTDEAEPALRALLTPDAHWALRAEAWSELAAIHDRRHEPDLAADAMEQTKAILRSLPEARTLAARAAKNNARLGALAEALDGETVRRWCDAPETPDARVGGIAHLIGFPRSGTTLLEQVLDAHPRLADSPERLVFTRDVLPRLTAGGLSVTTLDTLPREALDRERARYLDLMEQTLGEPLGGRVHLDKNPAHTGLLPGLLRLFGSSRFLVALRDPRDVVVSCYLRTFRLTEFSAAMLTWRGVCEMYASEMGAWLRYRRVLPPDRWAEVRYEDTVRDVGAQARRALDLLGLPWHDDILAWRERLADKVVNSPTHAEVRRPIHADAIGRWRRYERQLAPHADLLAPFIQALGYG